MTKKGIVTKTAGVLVAMVLTVMFALPTFTVDSNDGGYNRVYANYLD